eukprot:NODE_6_length_70510_cov_1.054395.p53 type:complete len:140 gc:universal NODE_6_length_70510_cov_1.054395:12724-13143(+)
MFEQSGFHLKWRAGKEVSSNCQYFKVPSDVIFDPFENPWCQISGEFDLEKPKEAWPKNLNVWCPNQVTELHFLCRYQNTGGNCLMYEPVPSECLKIPESQFTKKYFEIPVKDEFHADFVINSTLIYLLFVSLFLLKRIL